MIYAYHMDGINLNKKEVYMKNNFKEKTAFTLAEVLITLGIIGIVSAMTIPTLINNYQKKVTVNKLKQAYSLLKQAVQLSEVENGFKETWNFSFEEDTRYEANKRIAETYFIPYLKTSKKYEQGQGHQFKYLGGLDWLSFEPIFSFTLTNGMTVFIHTQDTWVPIYVDINAGSAPNIVGKDVFVFELHKTSKRGLDLYGDNTNNTDELMERIVTECSHSDMGRPGHTCGALIKYSGWKITDDYPW